MKRFLSRWAVMVMLIVPLALLAATAVLQLLSPSTDPREQSFSHALGDVVGFYVGYAVLAGTVASLLHTYLAGRLDRRLAPGPSAALGALVGVLVLLPQAVLLGAGFWIPSLTTGALAGMTYGALVAAFGRDGTWPRRASPSPPPNEAR